MLFVSFAFRVLPEIPAGHDSRGAPGQRHSNGLPDVTHLGVLSRIRQEVNQDSLDDGRQLDVATMAIRGRKLAVVVRARPG
jgi:hypothetical protein